MNKRSFRRKKIAMGVFVAASSSPTAFADICFISDSLSARSPGWVTSSPIAVGSLPGKTEMLTIKNGGQLTTGGGSFGVVNDSTGSGVVEGAGSAWTINDVLYIGNQGNGSLKILSGGAVTNNGDSTCIGFDSDSKGYLEVGDADSQFAAPAGTLTAGESGAGIITVSKSGDNSVTDCMVITGNATGTSFVRVNNPGGSGAAPLNVIKLIEFQGNANGEFIQRGRIVTGAYDYLMINAGSNGYLSAETTAISVPEPEPIPESHPVPGPTPAPEPAPAPAQPSGKKQILRPEGAANVAATLSLFISVLACFLNIFLLVSQRYEFVQSE